MIEKSLRHSTLFGLIWVGIQRFGTMIISFLSNIVLARMLSPEDFGCIGMLLVFIAISNTFVDGGFGSALIQKKEPTDVETLSRKLRSIKSFHGIRMPVKEVQGGWMPDFTSRYFLEDFNCGLARYRMLAVENNVDCPTLEKVYQWGTDLLSKTHMKS